MLAKKKNTLIQQNRKLQSKVPLNLKQTVIEFPAEKRFEKAIGMQKLKEEQKLDYSNKIMFTIKENYSIFNLLNV